MNVLRLDSKLTINQGVLEAPNLCDRLSTADLKRIGLLVSEGYERDKNSRIRWMRRMEAGMDLAMQVQQAKNFPWPGCSNVIFPLVTIAALQFSARSYSNIISGVDVVRYRVVGEDPQGVARSRADRISKHMSWQVLEEDMSWEEQHDRLLINLGIVGTNFIKTYFSPKLGHNVSELVMARDLVLDYYAKSIENAARKTQLVPMYRNEIYERVHDRVFRDILEDGWYASPPQPPLGASSQDTRQGREIPQSDEDTPFQTLEQHRLLDLDHDGYAEPYIVTIEEHSKEVLRIVARFDREEDVERTPSKAIHRIHPTEYFTKYSFIPAPDGGIYDVGFGVLLGPLNEAVSTGINQLLDSGTMQNSMGGFLGRGAKIRGGVYTMAPWEWKRVDSTGDDLRKSMVPFPERQPSAVMFNLLGLLIEYTQHIAGAEDQVLGKNPGQNTPAETSRNTMEQGLQVYGMIFKRVWRSMKEEFKKLHKLNGTYLPLKQRFGAVGSFVMQEDYRSNPDLVVPVADPNVTSAGLRLVQAQMLREAAHSVQGYDIPEVEKNFLRALRLDGIDNFYKGPDHVPPLPNPKVQVEQMKLQGKKMELDHEKQMYVNELLSERKESEARVMLLYAQVEKLMSEVGIEKAKIQLQALETAIGALQAHEDMITDRLKILTSGGSDGDSNGGGVPRVAQPQGNAGNVPALPNMEGGDQDPMGGGGLPGG